LAKKCSLKKYVMYTLRLESTLKIESYVLALHDFTKSTSASFYFIWALYVKRFVYICSRAVCIYSLIEGK